jgi:hypothetical protein
MPKMDFHSEKTMEKTILVRSLHSPLRMVLPLPLYAARSPPRPLPPTFIPHLRERKSRTESKEGF